MKKQKPKRTLVVKSRIHPLVVDRVTYVIAIIEPIITIPQAVQIFRNQNAEGISIFSWIGYELFTIIWLWYGLVHKDKVITVYCIMYAFIQAAIIIGAILYGGSWF